MRNITHNPFMARYLGAVCFMSAEGAVAGSDNKDVAPATELMERFEKKGKVVALPTDNQDDFIDFTGLFNDNEGKPTYVNWAEKADAAIFTGMAMVKPETGAPRLIGIASEEAVFADPASRKALYKMYVNRVVNQAGDDEVNPANFLTVGGCFKQKFDLEAFKFQAKMLTMVMRKQGLSGVTNKSLQLAFASAAFAKTQFPRVKDADWDKVIASAEQIAQKHGYETSIFEHWKATRAIASGDTSELELNLEAIMTAGEALPVEREDAPASA